ncbi:MAG: CDP-glycerol glycerophosphotransferase family protein [Chlamydiota bacterium]
MQKKTIAILTGPDTYLDHLAPICYLMNMPLIITEEKTYSSALTFYPQIETIKKDHIELSTDFLAENFDVIFESGKFWSMELKPLFSLLHKKEMRFVFCPHGNSDKGHSIKNPIDQDLSLVYGNHMVDLLTKTGAIRHITSLVRTGNYRLPFYRKYQSFYDSLVEKQISHKIDAAKKVILYAPTWQDGENPTSFFTCTKKLIEELKNDFTLIIKLHPFLEEFHPAHTYYITSLYENVPGVIFLNNFPSIYSLLRICDLYIGDYSSIGYDFLAFNRPLYFLTEKDPALSMLHPCGLVIPEVEGINAFIQKTLEFNQKEKEASRKSLYTHAFGEERSFADIEQEIAKKIT